jgi:signal transduction histidine kinase
VTNAFDHGMPPVEVAVMRVGAMVQIRVSDSGAGVRDDIAARLFDRFATTRQRGGTGLGLFIIRELARAQGGDAWYEPPEVSDRRRPTFVVALPARGASSG